MERDRYPKKDALREQCFLQSLSYHFPTTVKTSMKILSVVFSVIVTFFTAVSVRADTEELDMVNRPVNTIGLTGLIVTTTPFTLPRGDFEIAASVLSETSSVPDYTLTEYPLSMTYGISKDMEIALRGSFLYREEYSATIKKRGGGDAWLSYKWNFLPQNENSALPAGALILSFMGITGDVKDGFNMVHDWGARIGITLGREIAWEDHVVGVYADAQLAVQDLNARQYRDEYAVANAGFLLPISKQRNLQILMEYTIVSGKRFVNVDGFDSSTFTYGLRMVSERFNLTVGDQFIHKKLEGYENSGRIIGTFSAKF